MRSWRASFWQTQGLQAGVCLGLRCARVHKQSKRGQLSTPDQRFCAGSMGSAYCMCACAYVHVRAHPSGHLPWAKSHRRNSAVQAAGGGCKRRLEARLIRGANRGGKRMLNSHGWGLRCSGMNGAQQGARRAQSRHAGARKGSRVKHQAAGRHGSAGELDKGQQEYRARQEGTRTHQAEGCQA